MLKKHLLLFALAFCGISYAQLSDGFSDGDFTNNPIWTGNDTAFIVDNAQLRSNNNDPANYYLSTPSTKATAAQWEFFVNLKFSTSGSNYVCVFLMSDNADLTIAQNGYFVKIGDTDDEISLYKIVGGTSTMIINGADGLVNSGSNNPFKIKVRRDINNLWTLEYDENATGNYVAGGSVTDNAINTASFFGLLITQSSAASPVNNHFFDDFWVGDIVLDTIPPVVTSVNIVSANQLDVLFDEALEQISAETVSNYTINQSIGNATNAILDGANPALVHLTFANNFVNMQNYVLSTENINDLSLNSAVLTQTPFTYLESQAPAIGDIIINEFLCDPAPTVGLPELEYVEIYNKSNKVFHLENWQLSDNSSSGTIGDYWILPHQYLILVPEGGDTVYAGACVVSSFPSLNNSDDDIVLQDTNGLVIDNISYTDDWYNNSDKNDGGYAIERINPNHPCSGIDNWRASENANGGTPVFINSVFDTTADITAPALASVYPDSVNWLTIQFSEQLDSLDLMNVQIDFNPAFTITNRFVSNAWSSVLQVQIMGTFETGKNYHIELQNITDCWGNAANLFGEFQLPSIAAEGDVIINEILFDPLTGGSDYVELYNNSSKTFNLKSWYLATLEDSITDLEPIVESNYLVIPGQYVLITEDTVQVKMTYPNYGWGTFILADMPSYSNDEGFVYLLNPNKATIDHVDYQDDWQFTLLEDTKGKSLERINPSGPSSDKSNWQTASETVSFGTPGRKNSQYLKTAQKGTISIEPSTFSPDNDGYQDFSLFNYVFSQPGMVGNIIIYDEMGRLVRNLANNYYFDTKGYIKWDGVRNDGMKAPVGRYIVLFDVHSATDETVLKERKVVIINAKIKH